MNLNKTDSKEGFLNRIIPLEEEMNLES